MWIGGRVPGALPRADEFPPFRRSVLREEIALQPCVLELIEADQMEPEPIFLIHFELRRKGRLTVSRKIAKKVLFFFRFSPPSGST